MSAEGAERLSAAIREKEEKRKSFSRRRAHNADADVDYINDRNAKFNKKLGMYVAHVCLIVPVLTNFFVPVRQNVSTVHTRRKSKTRWSAERHCRFLFVDY